MAKFYTEIHPSLQEFIKDQKIFFTATAPEQGRINLSPKGIDTFRCIDSQTVAYLDLTGSGNETAAHLIENGRITIMFCSFSEQPMILRLYGQGRVIHPRDQEWQTVSPLFESLPGKRQIIMIAVESVQTSCGYGVPIYELKEERKMIIDWATKKGEQGIKDYWQAKNLKSIDGLPTQLLDD
ncbi:pyridoxamine 5'-phosphate oxidase family protein [Allocoleopsis franciscana]|uniref:Putative hydrolase (Metallo-beta-lactamase superfamily) n=1 Tax=Allocoleopsis franciscana PCC 7113 TaxID=1173027 RepID=K9WJT2_9CYAN|nr:pyridoxamine 5'-phosphate oxidase family protein [Allocoleopsis franciscana]AFZ20655.1 putative hydrolase (metallo-beta-lactamase superfamily) [Allocoleopsis franciscana PCC 7113]